MWWEIYSCDVDTEDLILADQSERFSCWPWESKLPCWEGCMARNCQLSLGDEGFSPIVLRNHTLSSMPRPQAPERNVAPLMCCLKSCDTLNRGSSFIWSQLCLPRHLKGQYSRDNFFFQETNFDWRRILALFRRLASWRDDRLLSKSQLWGFSLTQEFLKGFSVISKGSAMVCNIWSRETRWCQPQISSQCSWVVQRGLVLVLWCAGGPLCCCKGRQGL